MLGRKFLENFWKYNLKGKREMKPWERKTNSSKPCASIATRNTELCHLCNTSATLFQVITSYIMHCCIIRQINVIQQQHIFFSWMNRPSDDSSRKKFLCDVWSFWIFFYEIIRVFCFYIFLNLKKLSFEILPWKSNQKPWVRNFYKCAQGADSAAAEVCHFWHF